MTKTSIPEADFARLTSLAFSLEGDIAELKAMTDIARDEVGNMTNCDTLRLYAVLKCLGLLVEDFEKTYVEPIMAFARTGRLPEAKTETADAD
jgi:hypothetical protein